MDVQGKSKIKKKIIMHLHLNESYLNISKIDAYL